MRLGDMLPLGMGLMMGAMGMWMLHGALTGDGGMPGAIFILAHVAVVGLGALAAAFGLHRRWPALRRIRLHRPSLRHAGVMLAVALGTAMVIHVIHGGPPWT
ncbi:hypothetical protein MWU54_06710 [Marivita sp. S6314]|uniref:hypothetical protein n=1 Tax=Marivita sp. S6314 TaxID=2926406 RepID=UPI001FF5FB35|nr:hypothetical protein [Marivita sp. S6314]MCK0149707.1 hypothetical protein [Marivita sp. S6314]